MDFQLSKSLEILSQTPETVKSLLGNLSDEWISSNIGEDTWSAFDVIGHYIHADETVWMPRAELILAQGEDITFKPSGGGGHDEIVKEKTLAELLDDFVKIRENNVEIIKSCNLTEEKLDLKGIHPVFGEVNLRQMLATWTVHDLTHIRQIVVTLAKQYTESTGPWKESLSILQ